MESSSFSVLIKAIDSKFTAILSMIATSIELNRFHLTQQVKFVGGEGIVRNFKLKAGTWVYLVEMPLGLAPSFGRVGA
jgi:hypothetical protein